MKEKRITLLITIYFCATIFAGCATNVPSSSDVFSTPNALTSEIRMQSSTLAEVAPLFDAPENWQEPYPRAMVLHGWHGSPDVSAAYAERYLFQEDGTFYFSQNGYLGGERLKYMGGEWRYTDEVLHLTVKHKIVIEGGEYIEGENVAPYTNSIIEGTIVRIELQEGSYETMELPIKIVELGEEITDASVFGSIMLGDLQLWSKGGVDYQELLTMWDDYK